MNNTEQFFFNIFENRKILFRCLKTDSKLIDASGYYNKLPMETLQYANDNDYEVYFVVNNGGYSNSEIKKINSLFIDLDCGRDKNNNYHSLEDVKQYKNKKINEINTFVVKPSYVIETRNGYHLYWVISGLNKDEFTNIENKLIQYFDADESVKKLCQLMRVPGFDWCKDKSNRFQINVLINNNIKYDRSNLETLMNVSINDIEKRGNVSCFKKEIHYPQNPSSCTIYSNNNIQYIINKDIKTLQDIIKPNEIVLYSGVEEYLKQQDLKQFLGVFGKNFNCIFHNDSHPSAGMITGRDDNAQIYSCFSCNFKGNIIRCVERILHCNRLDAIDFLCEVYKIKKEKTDYQIRQGEILKKNQEYLLSPEFEIENPETYARIKNYILLLNSIIVLAIQYLPPEGYSENDNPLFFSSIKYISEKVYQPNNYGKITDRIGLLAYLGLINKLNDENIPKDILSKMNEDAIKRKDNLGVNFSNRVSFFDIPSYCYDLLQFSEQKAIEFKEKGFTMKGWSKELLLRSLGETEANRVYPQMIKAKIPKKNMELTKKIEKRLLKLIEKKKWTTEKEILEGISYKKYYKETQIKRILCEILDKYDLERLRLNKELKNKYNITNLNGYPFIIVNKEIKHEILYSH